MTSPVIHQYGASVHQWGEFQPAAAPMNSTDSTDANSTSANRISPNTQHAGAPEPLVVNIHGGFWHADHDLAHARPFCAGLRRLGWATLNLEYRRVGHAGGGWPGTFDDVRAGLEVVDRLVVTGAVDAGRVVLTGHSAGGHLALWLAGVTDVPVQGVVAVAAVTDLVAAERASLSDRGTAAGDLMGMAPDDAWADASPITHVPLPMPAVLVHGDHDVHVPLSQSRDYVAAATAADGDARLEIVAGEDHFAILDPRSVTFATTADAISHLLT